MFAASVITRRTTMAAAASAVKASAACATSRHDHRQGGVAAREERRDGQPRDDSRTAPARMSRTVSPSALESARTVPVGCRALPTDDELACHLPARCPNRSPPHGGAGTARNASIEVMMTIGRTSTARVIPPARMLRPDPLSSSVFMNATTTDRPRSPYTTNGTPARLRMLIWMKRVSWYGGVLLEVDGGRQAERKGQGPPRSPRGWPCRRALGRPGLGGVGRQRRGQEPPRDRRTQAWPGSGRPR